MTVNKISWLISIGDNPLSSETIELPFSSKGKNDMRQAEDELEIYMSKHYPGKTYSIMYWDWIDPDNKMVECKTCGTWYGSVWNKKGGCPTCQENAARGKMREEERLCRERYKVEQKDRKFRWWNKRHSEFR